MKSEEQIRGTIATLESQIAESQALEQNLLRQHQQNTANLNQAVAENTKRFNELQGELRAYRAILEAVPEVTSETSSPP